MAAAKFFLVLSSLACVMVPTSRKSEPSISVNFACSSSGASFERSSDFSRANSAMLSLSRTANLLVLISALIGYWLR